MKNLLQKIKSISNKISTKIKDYYHLLFKSAADNHLRIQNLLKNPDGTYQVTVKFGSYSELKRYQRKLRRVTVSLSTAVAMVAVAFIVAPFVLHPSKSSAANFTWVQTGWGTHATNPDNATTNNKTTWKQFYVASDPSQMNTQSAASADHGANSVTLVGGAQVSVSQASDTELGAWSSSGDGFYVSGSGSAAKMNLKKPRGLACASGNECASTICSGSPLACTIPPCNAGTTCGQKCSYNNDEYATVQIGTQCWFAENLRTTKKADGVTDISALAYCGGDGTTGPNGCGSPWGRLYKWSTAMNISATYDTTSWNGVMATGAKIQGVCPTGWHIPSDYAGSASDDWQKLANYVGGNGNALKALNGWYGTNPATNGSGFAAAPAGYWNGGYFYDRTYSANFWSSSEDNAGYAWGRYLFYNNGGVGRDDYNKSLGFSVRCIKD